MGHSDASYAFFAHLNNFFTLKKDNKFSFLFAKSKVCTNFTSFSMP